MNEMPSPLLNARQVADYLGLTAATVLDWFEAGRLPGFRLGGRKGGPVRFRLDEVEATLAGWHTNRTICAACSTPTTAFVD